MNVLSAVRQYRLALSIVLTFVTFTASVAGINPEPLGFVLPPDVQKAMQEAKASASRPPTPPASVALPTLGAGSKHVPFRSPWVVEQEFGNSQPVSKSLNYEAPSSSASVSESALQGGTVAMLSSLPTAAGRIPATHDVSSTGAANYTIPIWTPPGARGIEPKLALIYSSSSPDSLMGPGWSLAGLSVIARCPKTLAQDGTLANVTLTTSDKFCLDGNKLRLTGGTYGANPSTYQTELETFSNVTANGTSGGGPQWFEVKGKDGLIYEYGNTVDSRIAGVGNATPYLWALSKVKDHQGNNMTISYTLSNGTFRPNVISYTQTPATSTAYNYTVVFGYDTRAAAVNLNGYVADASIQQTMVLTSIDVQHLTSTVRKYNIDYSTGSATGRPRVSAIQACTTTDCLKPTIISYQDGSAGIASPSVSVGTGATTGRMNTVDIDGDGRQDLVYAVASGSNQLWYAQFGTASGFGSAISTGVTLASSDAILFDDFLSEGHTTALVPQGGIWYLLRWNGSAFTTSSTALGVVSDSLAANLRFASADVNGDGRPDLISYHNSGIYTRLNTSSGTSAAFASTETLAYSGVVIGLAGNNSFPTSSLRRMDFNGDGRDDIVATIFTMVGGMPNISYYLLLSSGTTFTYGGTTGYTTSFVPFAFNNDACTDVAIPGSVMILACNGAPGSWVTYSGTPVLVADYDGDARSDIWINSGGSFQVYRSYGNSVSTPVATGISVDSGNYQVFDRNGDGLDDLVYANSGASYAVSYGLHNGVMPDLATSFTDGYGMNFSPVYYSIVQTNYAKYSDAVFPNYDYQRPMQVVIAFTASDGTGGIFQKQFSYYGARMNLQGRGFLGFDMRNDWDSRNGQYEHTYFSRSFPSIGMVTQHKRLQSNASTLISNTTNTLNSLSFGSGYDARALPYISQSITDGYEAGGILNGQWLTRTKTDTTLDTGSGSPLTVSVETTDKSTASPFYGDVHKVITTNTITNSTTYWCLGRPTQTAVQSILPNLISETRTTGATVDYFNCRNSVETIEPLSSTLKVTTTYGFDSCGNVSTVDVVGKNPNGTDMATRTTSSSYGTRCQLPESVTNPLSQTSTTAYNYDFGLPSSQTDPNGIAVSWQYDGYGRRKQEDRPDGTKTTWTYYFCDSSNSYCIGAPDLRWELAETLFDSSSGTIRSSYRFFDGFDRERYKEQHNLAGGMTWTSSSYHALGYEQVRSVPVFSGGWHYHLYGYDLVGRPTTDTLYQDTGTFYRQTSVAYEGRKTILTDAKGNITLKYTDVRGNLRQVVDPSPGGTSYYVSDPFGILRWTMDATGATSSVDLNARGFKYQSSDDDTGLGQYAVNSLGEMVSQTDAKGQTTTFVYDKLSRLTSRTEAEGTSTWTWGTSAAAHNIGRLASLSGPGYSESYSFDSIGRPSSTTYNADVAYQADYAYNASTGFLDNITYPTSTSGYRLRAQYQYQYGILSQVRDYYAPTTVWWRVNAQDARGNPMDEQFNNNVHVLSNNDEMTGHLNWRTSGNNAQYNNHQNVTYQWDKNENLTDRIDVNQSNLTEHVVYDSMDRLDYSTLNGTTNLDVTLGAGGNITNKSDVGSFNYTTAQSGCNYYTHTQPHAVRNAGGVIYCYDANGNMTKRNGATTSWYSYNLPNSISDGTSSSTFYYGPNRNRWKQLASYSGSSENTIYIGGLMEKVTVAGGTVYRHYLPAGGNTIVNARWSTGSNLTYFMTSDHLGSGSVITDGSGAALVKESFGAYGVRRGSNWTGTPSAADKTAIANATRDGFTGHEHIDNLNLIHMNGRVYDPVIAKFTSADPFSDTGLGSQGLNRFAYVGNRPLSLTDPTGFCGNSVFTDSQGFMHLNATPCWDPWWWPTIPSTPSTPGIPFIGGGYYVDPNGVTQGEVTSGITVTAKKDDSNCGHGSLGVGGAVQGPVLGPVGVGLSGGTSLGVSYEGGLLDTRLFAQFQAAPMAGSGIFAGIGLSVSGGGGPVSRGFDSAITVHSELNVGVGAGGSVVVDAPMPGAGRVEAGGFHGRLPGGRFGLAGGAASGVGVALTSTIGSPTLRELARDLGIDLGPSGQCRRN